MCGTCDNIDPQQRFDSSISHDATINLRNRGRDGQVIKQLFFEPEKYLLYDSSQYFSSKKGCKLTNKTFQILQEKLL